MTRKTLLVGKTFPRIEAEAKVTGQSRYWLDLPPATNTLYVGLVTSTRPHARILGIDTAPALQHEGVEAVLTAEHISGMLGNMLCDRPILAAHTVRYVGEPVALVLARSPAAAHSAAALVQVRYDDLPVAITADESLLPDAPILHPEFSAYQGAAALGGGDLPNVAARFTMTAGDLEAGWAQADVIIEQQYHTSVRHHAALERHGASARQKADGTLILWASTAAPYALRKEISRALGIDAQRLRVTCARVGGGIGAKSRTSIEALVVAAAMAYPGYTVHLELQQSGEFTSVFVRPALSAYLKMGVTRQGEIVAMQARYAWDVGASADACLETVWSAAYAGTGPYRIPHVAIDSEAVYTNHTPAAPMRGNDMAEVHWAIEQHIDQLAAAIDMDPVAFRLHNIVKGGDRLALGQIMHVTGLDQCLQKVTAAIDWQRRPDDRPSMARGKGLALFWSPTTVAPDHSAEACARFDDDGCTIAIDNEDAGTGLHTFVAQLAATELGLPLDWVQVSPVDTAQGLQYPQRKATAEVCSVGNAVLMAVRRLKVHLVQQVAAAWNESPNHIDIIDGIVISHATERQQALDEMFRAGIATAAGPSFLRPLEARGYATPSPFFASDDPEIASILYFCAGAAAAEVEVNRTTGEVKVLQLAAAVDVGHAINPDLVLSQMKGGALQGLGAALWENLIYKDGVPINPDLYNYHVAMFTDLPAQLFAHIVEVPQEGGPYGARSLAADVPVLVAPAVANAVAQAVGLRLTRMPITAETVWRFLREN